MTTNLSTSKTIEYMCPACGLNIQSGEAWRSACPVCGEKLNLTEPTPFQPLADLKTRIEAPTGITKPASNPDLPKNIGGYEILDILGMGGMGVVYLAYEPLLDRQVALKLLSSQHMDPELEAKAARFLSESVITGKLGHPGIVPIYQVSHDERVGYFYTMRFVNGSTLFKIINDLISTNLAVQQEYSLPKLLKIFLRVCEAMSFAHRNGVLHRDLKPSNIMVGEFGEVLVMDWGLAKCQEGSSMTQGRSSQQLQQRLAEVQVRRKASTRLFLSRAKIPPTGTSILKHLQNQRKNMDNRESTPNAQVVGTPGFLSPEQGRCELNLTPASDVYSLGIILYQLLSLRSPIATQNPIELVANTIAGNIISLTRLPDAHRIPKNLIEITQKAISLKPEDRYADAGKLAQDIEHYLEGRTPQKLIMSDLFNRDTLGSDWQAKNGEPELRSNGLFCPQGTRLRCRPISHGGFESYLEFVPQGGDGEWICSIQIYDPKDKTCQVPYYEIRLGVEDRPLIELRRCGRRVQRRFDIRVQSSAKFSVKIEVAENHIRVSSGGRKYIEYKESFPLPGGCVEIDCPTGNIVLQRMEFWSRGAPLHLPYHFLPDQLFQQNKFGEARELYRNLALSHPDREEGLLALYKAGLCSAELRQTQDAFAEFSKLEGTLYDHCCALGLAQIGMLEGTIDFAWEALKNGYRTHRNYDVGTEMWFSMLALIARMEKTSSIEKVNRYLELIDELDPHAQQMEQVTFELLDLVQSSSGIPVMRTQAIELLRRYPERLNIASEALWAVCRAGLDEGSLESVKVALERSIPMAGASPLLARFHILYAEILLAEANLSKAAEHLKDAVTLAGRDSSEGLWANGWIILIRYLSGDYLKALTLAHEELNRQRGAEFHHLAYFRLLEGLAFLARNQRDDALRAFERGAAFACPWGYGCQQILDRTPPETFREKLTKFNRHQFVETLFLVGEANVLLKNTDLAKEYYQISVCCDRAMISRFSQRRLQGLK